MDFERLEIVKNEKDFSYNIVFRMDGKTVIIPKVVFNIKDFINIFDNITNKQDNFCEHNAFIDISLNGTMLATLDENDRAMYYKVYEIKEK